LGKKMQVSVELPAIDVSESSSEDEAEVDLADGDCDDGGGGGDDADGDCPGGGPGGRAKMPARRKAKAYRKLGAPAAPRSQCVGCCRPVRIGNSFLLWGRAGGIPLALPVLRWAPSLFYNWLN